MIAYIKNHGGPEKAAAYINAVNEDGETCLHYACNITKDQVKTPHADKEIIKCLFENGADVSIQTKQEHDTAFHYVAVAGNNDIMMQMLSYLSPTEIAKDLNRQNAIGWTPLLIAAHKGHMELVTSLLGNHSRVDVFDNDGRSALHLAAERGYLQVIHSNLFL